MVYFSFVALMMAGAALIYAEENKKQNKLLMIRVEALERQKNSEQRKNFGDRL